MNNPAGIMALASSASAATVVSGTVCEGSVAPAISASACDMALGDSRNTPSRFILTPGGGFGFYGGVANGSRADQDLETWRSDFGADRYNLSFNWAPNRNSNFDGLLFVNYASYAFDAALNPTVASISLGALSGSVAFIVNPILGSFVPQERGTWDLQVSPVSLPASLPLLALGLGGLAFACRRTAASSQGLSIKQKKGAPTGTPCRMSQARS